MIALAPLLFAASTTCGAPPSAEAIFVDVDQARALVADGAVVLDARGGGARAPFLPNAAVIDWTVTRQGRGASGLLPEDLDALARSFGALGVARDRPVLVYGAMNAGWGEEGRVWWVLRYLGVERTFILDGGIEAWRRTGQKTSDAPAARSSKADGALAPKVRAELRADWRAVDEARRAGSAKLLDVRTKSEVEGATLYGEARGGHVPGAVHLDWHTLLGDDGRLLPKSAGVARLQSLGLEPGTRVITYCTGGVRSALVAAALMQYGFTNVANYDGSWIDWASRQELPVARGPAK